MAFNFHITVLGEKHAAQTLEGIAEQAANTRPAMEEIYLTILDIEDEAFDNEGARAGFPKWEEILLSTVLRKAAKKPPGDPRILHDTLRLRRGATGYRSKDQYTRIEQNKIVFMPRVMYRGVNIAKLHQFGYSIRIKSYMEWDDKMQRNRAQTHAKVPARPIVRFSKRDADAFGRELMRHLTRRAKGPGTMGVSLGH